MQDDSLLAFLLCFEVGGPVVFLIGSMLYGTYMVLEGVTISLLKGPMYIPQSYMEPLGSGSSDWPDASQNPKPTVYSRVPELNTITNLRQGSRYLILNETRLKEQMHVRIYIYICVIYIYM